MGANSHIEWTDNTFNIAEGCMKVSDGCKNCYAESRDKHWHGGCHWGPGSTRKMMSDSYWRKPFMWNLQASKAGIKTKVFCSSLCDVFEDHADLVQPRERLFAMIADTPNLIWQLLTKRPENIKKMVPERWNTEGWPTNVWMGTTVESQATANERIPFLLKVPAKVRFLSCEPLLSRVSFRWAQWHDFSSRTKTHNHYDGFAGIHWVICGGESGHNARPMHPDWARGLRDQCAEAGVPFFFKQWGEWASGHIDMGSKAMTFVQFRDFDQWVNKASTWVSGGICLDIDGKELKRGSDFEFASKNDKFPVTIMHKLGKKEAGNLLDGKIHQELPA